MVASMEPAVAGIVIMPLFIVDRDSHLGGIAVVETITALKILLPPEILGIVHVGIVVKPVPVNVGRRATPGLTKGLLVGVPGTWATHSSRTAHHSGDGHLSRSVTARSSRNCDHAAGGGQQYESTNHVIFPLDDWSMARNERHSDSSAQPGRPVEAN